jgi:diguanylate cyclase (GGDEF)-like protein
LTDSDAQLQRLEKKLRREKRARSEAESIAERSTRELYEAVQELTRSANVMKLVGSIAAAANEATCIEDAVQACLDEVCRYTGWSLGHAYEPDPARPDELTSMRLWHAAGGVDYSAFIAESEKNGFQRGIGLPGRVLASAEPAWIADVTADVNFTRASGAAEVGLRAAFAFPVIVRSEVAAVLEFFSPEHRTMSPSFLQAMATMGSQLGRVIERDLAEERLTYQAMHDQLTGLPNRALLLDRLTQAIARADRFDHSLEVLFLDLDDFKTINDSLGHEAGDRVLSVFAERIGGCVRSADTVARGTTSTVARLGGDEFAVILEDCLDLEVVVDRIAVALRAPLMIDGQEVFLSASIGGADAKLSGGSADRVLRSADAAMYVAKNGGKARFERFEPSMHSAVRKRLQLIGELRQAVDSGEFALWFQPEIRLSDRALVGVEALLRWEHPTRGFIPPDVFIPLAEETGLILPLGDWVLAEACRQAMVWNEGKGDLSDLVMSVNVSGRQLVEASFTDSVKGALADTGFDPSLLCLEMTESLLVEHEQQTVPMIQALKALGVTFAVDDFGTGYSSLASLQKFPIDLLKVDRSFIARLPEDDDAGTIVWAVVRLAHSLGLTVIAEGIETQPQLEEVRRFGCDVVQGYFFSRPVPPDQMERLSLPRPAEEKRGFGSMRRKLRQRQRS